MPRSAETTLSGNEGQQSEKTLNRARRVSSTLNMQGTSLLVAWITSDTRTELTEKASSLEHTPPQGRSGQNLAVLAASSCYSPEIQHQTCNHTWLSGLSFRNIVEKQLAVRDNGEDPLPALLHAAGLGDLAEDRNIAVWWTRGCVL